MTRPRNDTGFSLTELLLTLAIVGVLASMLLPAFARARAEARGLQCLSNVRSIAQAIAMYQHDWGALFPRERDPRAIAVLNQRPVGLKTRTVTGDCPQLLSADPYLRPALLLEKYLKDRSAWDCPSAKLRNGATFIVPVGPKGDWVQAYVDNAGRDVSGVCSGTYPPGWGGTVTDSFLQRPAASPRSNRPGANRAFQQALAVNSNLRDLDLASVRDPARYVACGDDSRQVEIDRIESVAFPDTCKLNGMSTDSDPGACADADWEDCPWTQQCGLSAKARVRVLKDASYLRTFIRHDGGSNVGFLDGHAKWYLWDWLVYNAQPFLNPRLEGVCSCWSDAETSASGTRSRRPLGNAMRPGA